MGSVINAGKILRGLLRAIPNDNSASVRTWENQVQTLFSNPVHFIFDTLADRDSFFTSNLNELYAFNTFVGVEGEGIYYWTGETNPTSYSNSNFTELGSGGGGGTGNSVTSATLAADTTNLMLSLARTTGSPITASIPLASLGISGATNNFVDSAAFSVDATNRELDLTLGYSDGTTADLVASIPFSSLPFANDVSLSVQGTNLVATLSRNGLTATTSSISLSSLNVMTMGGGSGGDVTSLSFTFDDNTYALAAALAQTSGTSPINAAAVDLSALRDGFVTDLTTSFNTSNQVLSFTLPVSGGSDISRTVDLSSLATGGDVTSLAFTFDDTTYALAASLAQSSGTTPINAAAIDLSALRDGFVTGLTASFNTSNQVLSFTLPVSGGSDISRTVDLSSLATGGDVTSLSFTFDDNTYALAASLAQSSGTSPITATAIDLSALRDGFVTGLTTAFDTSTQALSFTLPVSGGSDISRTVDLSSLATGGDVTSLALTFNTTNFTLSGSLQQSSGITPINISAIDLSALRDGFVTDLTTSFNTNTQALSFTLSVSGGSDISRTVDLSSLSGGGGTPISGITEQQALQLIEEHRLFTENQVEDVVGILALSTVTTSETLADITDTTTFQTGEGDPLVFTTRADGFAFATNTTVEIRIARADTDKDYAITLRRGSAAAGDYYAIYRTNLDFVEDDRDNTYLLLGNAGDSGQLVRVRIGDIIEVHELTASYSADLDVTTPKARIDASVLNNIRQAASNGQITSSSPAGQLGHALIFAGDGTNRIIGTRPFPTGAGLTAEEAALLASLGDTVNVVSTEPIGPEDAFFSSSPAPDERPPSSTDIAEPTTDASVIYLYADFDTDNTVEYIVRVFTLIDPTQPVTDDNLTQEGDDIVVQDTEAGDGINNPSAVEPISGVRYTRFQFDGSILGAGHVYRVYRRLEEEQLEQVVTERQARIARDNQLQNEIDNLDRGNSASVLPENIRRLTGFFDDKLNIDVEASRLLSQYSGTVLNLREIVAGTETQQRAWAAAGIVGSAGITAATQTQTDGTTAIAVDNRYIPANVTPSAAPNAERRPVPDPNNPLSNLQVPSTRGQHRINLTGTPAVAQLVTAFAFVKDASFTSFNPATSNTDNTPITPSLLETATGDILLRINTDGHIGVYQAPTNSNTHTDTVNLLLTTGGTSHTVSAVDPSSFNRIGFVLEDEDNLTITFRLRNTSIQADDETFAFTIPNRDANHDSSFQYTSDGQNVRVSFNYRPDFPTNLDSSNPSSTTANIIVVQFQDESGGPQRPPNFRITAEDTVTTIVPGAGQSYTSTRQRIPVDEDIVSVLVALENDLTDATASTVATISINGQLTERIDLGTRFDFTTYSPVIGDDRLPINYFFQSVFYRSTTLTEDQLGPLSRDWARYHSHPPITTTISDASTLNLTNAQLRIDGGSPIPTERILLLVPRSGTTGGFLDDSIQATNNNGQLLVNPTRGTRRFVLPVDWRNYRFLWLSIAIFGNTGISEKRENLISLRGLDVSFQTVRIAGSSDIIYNPATRSIQLDLNNTEGGFADTGLVEVSLISLPSILITP